MAHSKFFIKNLVSIFMIAVISFFSAIVIFAQCEGIYFKPTGKTVTDPQVFIYGLQKEFAADLTEDGKHDLVAIEFTPPRIFNKIFIYPGDGAGGFGARTVINLPGEVREYDGYYLRDFNGDNKTDLIVQYITANGFSNVLVYLNNGTGTPTPLTPTRIIGELINLADINNDRRQDLIILSGSNIYYHLANVDGSFGTPVQLPQVTLVGRHAGDFDGDGDIDFATLDSGTATRTFRIVVNQGNGTFTVSNPLVSLDTDYLIFFDAVTDLNNDGRPDIVFTNYGNTPKITILLNQGNNNFTKTDYVMGSSPGISFTHLGDFNGDGFIDLFNRIHTQQSSYATGYIVSLNNGAGTFTQRSYPFGGLDSYDDRPAGDFNNDGKTDFIRINNAGRSAAQYRANIFNETQFTVKINVCNNFGQPKIVDFDRDRRTDSTLWRASDGRWRYQGSNGTPAATFYWGAPNDKPVPGDYDGDGGSDAAVFRADGFWYVRNSSDNSTTAVQFGTGTDKPVPADYNGDGRTDIAVYRPSNGTWYFLMSGTNQFSARQFGIAEDIPVPEDYDGDERADIAVFRPSQGFWYILRSSNNSIYGVQWGVGTDEAHPADYDGDGKADFCVRRRSNNFWYILRSHNNQTGAIQFGISEDIAQIGDWDGNSIMDIGVYRPSTRRWYATTEGGAYLPAFGEAGEIPVASIQR